MPYNFTYWIKDKPRIGGGVRRRMARSQREYEGRLFIIRVLERFHGSEAGCPIFGIFRKGKKNRKAPGNLT